MDLRAAKSHALPARPLAQSRGVLLLPFACSIGLAALSLLPRVSAAPGVRIAFWAASAVLAVWTACLAGWSIRTRRDLFLDWRLVRSHWVQPLMHGAIYLYWGWYWPPVYDHAWLIAGQILFLYGVDSLLSWSRGSRWTMGFGPIPIILSTNLFLWFRDDVFALQFLMVAVGSFGKHFIRWQRDGRRVHIFNPSGLSLSVASLVLILTGTTSRTWGAEIASTLAYPDHIYFLIFAVGLVVMALFEVTLVTLGAMAALVLLNLAYATATGVYFFTDTYIPIAVFLGLHLLVTDPATSPSTPAGRAVFGVLYGAGVFALYALLTALGIPSFYDKLLCVPLLNLGVPWIDRVMRSGGTSRWVAWLDRPAFPRWANPSHMAVWVALCAPLLAIGYLGPYHPGASLAFWEEACEAQRFGACPRLTRTLEVRCSAGDATACSEHGRLLASGALGAVDQKASAGRFAIACGLGEATGCANLMIQCLFQGGCPGHEPALGLAVGPLTDSCEGGEGQRCEIMGHAYAAGAGVEQDAARAAEYFKRACDVGWTRGCVLHARSLFESGQERPGNVELAAASLRAACSGGDQASCAYLETQRASEPGGAAHVLR